MISTFIQILMSVKTLQTLAMKVIMKSAQTTKALLNVIASLDMKTPMELVKVIIKKKNIKITLIL